MLMSTRKHAEGAVVFDEAHAAHVGGQIIDDAGVLEGLLASLAPLQVQNQVFHAGEIWYHSASGLISTERRSV